MGTGQTLLTIMAMLMLSRLILSVNTNTAQNGASIEMAAYRITASSLGFSIIEEASGLAFDQASVASNITATSQLSTTLGPETGEVYPNFNDFDDFNGLVKIDTVANSAVFKTTVVVQYVTVSGSSIVVSSTPDVQQANYCQSIQRFHERYVDIPGRYELLVFSVNGARRQGNMGSQVILDIISSSFVFGTLLVMALRLNGSVTENLETYNGEVIVQDNMCDVVNMIHYDFRKIGTVWTRRKYRIHTKAIIYADTSSIKFYTDLSTAANPYGDGVLDIVDDYLGPTSELSMTPNPNDRILYRVVNNAPPKGSNLGVTKFSLMDFGALNDTLPTPVANPGAIWSMQITVQVQNYSMASLQYNTAKFDNPITQSYWRQMRLVSRNLKNR